jgi:predicted nucleic acid-binding protein
VSDYVTDTHALLWHLASDPRLSSTARKLFTETDAGHHRIYVPSIVLVEVIYLAEKARIDPKALKQTLHLLNSSPANYPLISLDLAVILVLQSINRTLIPGMPDRIIAATAKHLNLPLITRDTAIAAAETVAVIW